MDKWWEKAVFYEIYVPGFCDGNADGIGDLYGLKTKIPYLKSLGIDAVWITPFYQSPKVDNGYDISDYLSVDPIYGDMDILDRLISELHQNGIRVVIDMVLNHTSDKHPWFVESRSSVSNPKRNWYIWKKPKDKSAPNNWESLFGGSAWEFDDATGQYYYHAFSKEQPDLNWTNPEVVAAMKKVMGFWMEKGVDGFRLDVINFLSTDLTMPDNPFDDDGVQIHANDKDYEGIFDVLKGIRDFVDKYEDRVLIGEIGSDKFDEIKPYMLGKELDLVFNFNLGSISELDISKMYREIVKMNEPPYDRSLPTIFFSSHDMARHISRFGENTNLVAVSSTFLLTARGIPFIYNGEEMGLANTYFDDISKMKDIQGILAYHSEISSGKNHDQAIKTANAKGRDGSRILLNWKEMNNQYNHFYRNMIKLRKSYKSLIKGEYGVINNEDGMLWYSRELDDERIIVILNFRDTSKIWKGDIENAELIFSNKRNQFDLNLYGNTILPFEAILIKTFGGKHENN